MKQFLWIAGLTAGCMSIMGLVTMVITLGTQLLSAADTMQVLAGAVLMIVLLTTILTGGYMVLQRLFFSLLIAGLLVGSTGCGTRVDPGHVGLKVNYYGTNRGVSDIPIVTGMVWYNPFTTTVFQYPTFVQTAVWTASKDEGKPVDESISFNSKEGLVFNADISLSYHLEATGVPAFYVKFRNDDIAVFTHGFLRNVARDAFNESAVAYSAEEIYGDKKEQLLKDVVTRIHNKTSEYRVVVEQFGFIGVPRPPANVTDAINAKIQATQSAIRVENELRQAQAQAKKDVAKAEGEARAAVAKAEGEAKANSVLAQSLSPALIQWRSLNLTEQAIAKWNGQRPQVEGSASGLLLQVAPR